MTLGKKIRAFRKERGWNIEELAERSNTQQSTISNLENDLRDPQYGTLLKIANAFTIPIHELLPYEQSFKESTTELIQDIKKINEYILEMSEEQRKGLIVFLESYFKTD